MTSLKSPTMDDGRDVWGRSPEPARTSENVPLLIFLFCAFQGIEAINIGAG